VSALAGQGVEHQRQRRDQRLAFTGLHLGDGAAVQGNTADELHIVVTHADRAHADFAHRRKDLRQQVVERRAVVDLFSEFRRLGFQLRVRELFQLWLEGAHLLNDGLHLFDLALVFGANDFLEDVLEHEVALFFGGVMCPYSARTAVWAMMSGVAALELGVRRSPRSAYCRQKIGHDGSVARL
jgi:hypothetical protein